MGVAEEEMLAELFAVVRGDDHVCVPKNPLDFQVLEQATELFIEEGDAIVVTVAGHQDIPFRYQVLVHFHEINKNLAIPWVAGRIPKRPTRPGGAIYGAWASK